MQNPVDLLLGVILAASGVYSILYPEKVRQWLIKTQPFDWGKKSVSDLLDRFSMPAYGVIVIAVGALAIYRAFG